MKKFTILFLAFLLIFTAAACGGDPSEDGSDINTIAVTISIIYPEDAKKQNVESYDLQVQEEATVMQILESYCDQEGIENEVVTSTAPHVTSINGVRAAGDLGWVFEVNGDSRTTKGAAEYKVKDGDKIVWKFAAS